MTTFGAMVTRIAREIRRDNLTADIKDAIVSAIHEHEEERFYFNEGEATATATTGVAVYSFPTRFIELDEVQVIDSASSRESLVLTHWEDIDAEDAEPNGHPHRYAVHGEQLHIRPPADGVYVLKASGHKQLTEVSASASDAATNAWMTDAERLIRLRAKAYLFDDRLRHPQQAAIMNGRADGALRSLRRRTVSMISAGRVRKTCF